MGTVIGRYGLYILAVSIVITAVVLIIDYFLRPQVSVLATIIKKHKKDAEAASLAQKKKILRRKK